MKILEHRQAREDYVRTQIERSKTKFPYCKVSVRDVVRYRELLRSKGSQVVEGPILCLGTRNGREVDLFRQVFFGPKPLAWLIGRLERRTHSFVSACPALERIGRSPADNVGLSSVIGVELNPMARRSDVWIGSFDDMPEEWEQTFGVLYSNAFDQAQDPERTAAEWRRVLRPGGHLIFCFGAQTQPTSHDQIAAITLNDVRELFAGDLSYFRYRGSAAGYSEVILHLP